MMTPDPRKEVLDEVRQMLAGATPEQMRKLLRDIMQSAPAIKESAKYDA